MYYRRCETCGAKALASATRCPRCEEAFQLYDERGKRLRLVPCTGCKVVGPVAERSCRWCGTERRTTPRIPLKVVTTGTSLIAASALLFASRGAMTQWVESTWNARTQVAPVNVVSAAGVSTPPVATTLSSAGAPVADSSASATAEPQEPDSVHWQEAKATTWVNVRVENRRDATVLAVLNPDDIVQLGATASGWRQVSVAGATGWVDPRHFAIAQQ